MSSERVANTQHVWNGLVIGGLFSLMLTIFLILFLWSLQVTAGAYA